jgi:hypothetical protein
MAKSERKHKVQNMLLGQYLRINLSLIIDRELILWLLDGKTIMENPVAAARRKLYKVYKEIKKAEAVK